MTSRETPGFFYGWLVLGAAFVTLLLTVGVWHSFGVFFKPILAEFGSGRGALSLASSINMVVIALLFPVAGFIFDRWGPRALTSVSVALIAVTLFALSRVTALWQLFLLYGLVAGVAFSGSSIPTMTALVSQWFVARRGMAISLAVTGASTGIVVMVPLSSILLVKFGWRTSYAIMAAMVAVIVLPLTTTVMKRAPSHLSPSGTRAGLDRGMLWRSLKDKPFWLLSASLFVCGFQDFLFFTHFIPHATDLGFSEVTSGTILGLAGAANIAGTLFIGIASDRIGRRIPFVATFLIRAVSFLLALGSGYAPFLILFAIIFGATNMATAVLGPAIIGDLYGQSGLATLVGVSVFIHHTGGGLGTYLGGLVFDLTGSYSSAFGTAALLALIAAWTGYRVWSTR